ncbi:DUF2515 domain-containing protein [Robertmurraya kyonggiensis]|uniref:DUF2515 domain-containing protein n=1 Tax=Robertmurraya kyonggiensis TaxID=1037680 RepID=A0A4U1D9Q7_9BACI|nr:DUF2515 domain-containing protein [Robertmurraya kyonggiensis]TKC19295.1 DUF2515 domain-containing protein [Robertmurraya kyonggiensis]
MCKFIKKTTALPISLAIIKNELKNKNQKNWIDRPVSLDEKRLVENIQQQTRQLNKNNVTRTKAYLDFYVKHPEIHWAFLGHMVSRNGGWNMTDLKGGLLSRLLSKKERESFFAFLERGNWLIFQDAYPQFLLYEESIRKGQNLFHLLPFFHVSVFMETIWNDFWKHHDSYLLAIALVINEQSYLENRVVRHPTFKKEVFDSMEFLLQDILSMNHILFPFETGKHISLVGETLHQFERLHERIMLGKRLYQILFGAEERKEKILQWAVSTPHTGSRKDYWPAIFNEVEEAVPGTVWKRRFKDCELLPGSQRLYSPQLTTAWKNRIQKPAEEGDWFKNWKVIYYLLETKEDIDGEIRNEYCKTLEKLELAAIAKKAVSILD